MVNKIIKKHKKKIIILCVVSVVVVIGIIGRNSISSYAESVFTGVMVSAGWLKPYRETLYGSVGNDLSKNKDEASYAIDPAIEIKYNKVKSTSNTAIYNYDNKKVKTTWIDGKNIYYIKSTFYDIYSDTQVKSSGVSKPTDGSGIGYFNNWNKKIRIK